MCRALLLPWGSRDVAVLCVHGSSERSLGMGGLHLIVLLKSADSTACSHQAKLQRLWQPRLQALEEAEHMLSMHLT